MAATQKNRQPGGRKPAPSGDRHRSAAPGKHTSPYSSKAKPANGAKNQPGKAKPGNGGKAQPNKGKPAYGAKDARRPYTKKRTYDKPENTAESASGVGIQWFPGHMARTRRKIKESLSLVDAVVEIVDARIPLASRNPEMDSLTGRKPRLVILNKADLADEGATKRWIAYYRSRGMAALAVDCKTGRGCNQFQGTLRELLKDLVDKWESKGANLSIRAMVVGIPNVGKSSFINRMTSGGKAKVEDRPGVTRQNQWFVLDSGTQLLDTPGVLWPKFEDRQTAMHLAFTGAIKDQVLDMEEMACELLRVLYADYRHLLMERYKLEENMPADPWELLQAVAKKRGMLVSGGETDTGRAAIMLLDEYRSGKLGRLTLELPEMGKDDSRA